jgi:hypothetical protein
MLRTFEKTLAYVKRFGGITNAETTTTIRELCQSRGLMDFEAAAVTNLQPQNHDEAKTLVPSIEVGAVLYFCKLHVPDVMSFQINPSMPYSICALLHPKRQNLNLISSTLNPERRTQHPQLVCIVGMELI